MNLLSCKTPHDISIALSIKLQNEDTMEIKGNFLAGDDIYIALKHLLIEKNVDTVYLLDQK